MKYYVILLLGVVLFLNTKLIAQNNSDESVGIRAGFHSANMDFEGNKPDTAKSVNNFYIGFGREKQVTDLLYWGTGIEYFQNGLRYTNSSKRLLHTLSVPVNLKLKIGPVFGLVGAAANFKVSEKIVVGDNSLSPIDSDKSNWFDVPVFLGAGVKILFVSVEARYHWGLMEVRNGMHNRYFQLGAVVSF
ncbi:hypothetical protein [Carboxylicivirga sp. N1Y90]|uniref:hypothetical protein n=1 Tax=Carboxylicivirga fragile TaxID=3417571 RepID=UPI003D352FF5|nr:outer membrane beta-barrel protein [Marinilabiliaceae bacterium N1Y90]